MSEDLIIVKRKDFDHFKAQAIAFVGLIEENNRHKQALEEIKEITEEASETPGLYEIWDITNEALKGGI